ncbi:MAG: hypothetical protein AAGA75_09920 [Cyanobacteria bacterium P01_E01_bin.6]
MTFGIAHQAGDHPAYPRPLPSNKFADLWHRWDFIEAKSSPTESHPQWQRIKAFPLEPRPLMRRWGDPDLLVGVSFGKQTRYCMVDIDAGSQYHPDRYPSAYRQVLDQLEDIGLVEPLVLTSSESGGLHLYYPLPISVSSYKLGHLLKHTCEQGGLAVKAGQLELFPNARRFSLSNIVLYQAHRLPLQQGSCLLDEDGNAIGNDLNLFMFHWKRAASRQDSDLLSESLQNLTKVIPFPYERRSERAKAFEADDQARIEQGWTGPGQTNGLLGAIARYGRVWEGLADGELAKYIESVAVDLPGYQDHCHHKDDIGKRSLEWASSSTKHYYPYSERAGKVDKPKHPTNEERQQAACERIKQAMKALIEAGKLALGITNRCQQLSQHGVSKETLYKNRELWHPEHYQEDSFAMPTNVPSPPVEETQPPLVPQPQSQPATPEITNPLQRSLGESESAFSSPKVKEKEQTKDLQDSTFPGEVLNQVKKVAGRYWSETLRRLVISARPQVVLKSLEAYVQQLRRGKISNPGAWLHRAIVEGYEPNSSSTETPALSGFTEWFDLARQKGLVVASEMSTGGEVSVYLSSGGKVLWKDLILQYPVESLSESDLVERGNQHDVNEPTPYEPCPMPKHLRDWLAKQRLNRISG